MHRLANDAQPPAYGVRPAAKKIPVSVLVVVYCVELEVLLLERADRPGYWQSVTGSKDDMSEDLVSTAARELREETGIEVGGNVLPRTALIDWDQRNVYEIHPAWRDRYAAGITHNVEHVFGVCVPRDSAVKVAPGEHLQYRWLTWRAAADACFSHTNANAIRQLPLRAGTRRA